MSTPCSTLEFFKVPALSPNYRDTYYFNDATAQYNFFHSTSNPKQLLYSQFTRVSNNQVKVPFPQTEMIEYNYMLIKNARGYETDTPTGKSFYCFITNCEYVSDMCTLITFKVDVIQSYIVQATLNESFVERCHVFSDNRYEHREPEPFTVANYTVDKRVFKELELYVVLGLVSGTEITIGGSLYTCGPRRYMNNKVYSGAQFLVFDMSDSADMTLLDSIMNDPNAVLGHPDAITDFYVVPKSSMVQTIGGFINPDTVGDTKSYAIDILPSPTSQISGYTPTNKKLYNYPFVKIIAQSSTGDSVELLGEEFELGYPLTDTEVGFKERGNWYGGGEAELFPQDYSIHNDMSIEYRIGIKDLPKCSWNGDSYMMWVMQKLNAQLTSSAISTLGSVLTTGLSFAMGGPLIGGMATAHSAGNILNNFGEIIADGIEAKNKTNPFYNKTTSAQLSMNYSNLGWVFERLSLTQAEAKQIDDFFTMFGYAQNKIMNIRDYLNTFGRAKFVYLKTQGFSVKGNFPSNYKNEFNDVFNNGITFWKTDATVGDYSNNSIVTP